MIFLVLGYKAALRNFDRLSDNGFFSFNEMVVRMDMPPWQLKCVIEMLDYMGHIEQVNTFCSTSSSSQCKRSHGINASLPGTIYHLTEKGRKVCTDG
jgi:hypothetical protein